MGGGPTKGAGTQHPTGLGGGSGTHSFFAGGAAVTIVFPSCATAETDKAANRLVMNTGVRLIIFTLI